MYNYVIGTFDTNCMIYKFLASGKASGRLDYYCLLSVNTPNREKLMAGLLMLGWANHLFVLKEPL